MSTSAGYLNAGQREIGMHRHAGRRIRRPRHQAELLHQRLERLARDAFAITNGAPGAK